MRRLRSGANVRASRMFSSGEAYGSRLNIWKMTPMRLARNRSRLGPFNAVRSTPSTSMLPLCGCATPQIKLRKVDFPEPLAPKRKTFSPTSTLKSATRSANPVRPGHANSRPRSRTAETSWFVVNPTSPRRDPARRCLATPQVMLHLPRSPVEPRALPRFRTRRNTRVRCASRASHLRSS